MEADTKQWNWKTMRNIFQKEICSMEHHVLVLGKKLWNGMAGMGLRNANLKSHFTLSSFSALHDFSECLYWREFLLKHHQHFCKLSSEYCLPIFNVKWLLKPLLRLFVVKNTRKLQCTGISMDQPYFLVLKFSYFDYFEVFSLLIQEMHFNALYLLYFLKWNDFFGFLSCLLFFIPLITDRHTTQALQTQGKQYS